MIAVRTQFTWDDNHADLGTPLSELRKAIERAIPLGAGHYNGGQTHTAISRVSELEEMQPRDYVAAYGVDKRGRPRAPWNLQLGSLGSGNHFIEVSVDEEDRVWLFLHSGSRGIGNNIATDHIRIAQELCWGFHLPHQDLAYFMEGTEQFDAYIADLNWAQHFALLNREEMMDRVIRQFCDYMGAQVEEQERINCHHNFTERLTGKSLDSWERVSGLDPFPSPTSFSSRKEAPGTHDGVWLSRKGAIAANEGQLGLIPGSMGTASYVVAGLGNPLSFNSSPHGAGRVLSRKKAKGAFTLQDLQDSMIGIEFRVTDAFLDEHPGAYKDIDQVMLDAQDLVEVRHTLHQIVNVKGD
jgi:tRNA-splicing ligase RtcB